MSEKMDRFTLAAHAALERPFECTIGGIPLSQYKFSKKTESEMSDYTKDMARIQRVIDSGEEMVALLKELVNPENSVMDLRIKAVLIIAKIEGKLE